MNNASFAPVMLAQAPATAPPLAGSGGPIPAGGETQQPLGADGAAGGAAPMGNPFSFMLPILLIFGVMIFFQIFAGRKERRKRQEMLSGVGKYDKIQTVGGLIGTVHEVKDSEITLKVDESTNTKVHISRSAIQTVLRKGPGSSSGKAETSDSKNETLEAVAS